MENNQTAAVSQSRRKLSTTAEASSWEIRGKKVKVLSAHCLPFVFPFLTGKEKGKRTRVIINVIGRLVRDGINRVRKFVYFIAEPQMPRHQVTNPLRHAARSQAWDLRRRRKRRRRRGGGGGGVGGRRAKKKKKKKKKKGQGGRAHP